MSSRARRTAAPGTGTPTIARTSTYLGTDVHKDSITIAVLPGSAEAPTRVEWLCNALPKLKKWIARVARDDEIQAC